MDKVNSYIYFSLYYYIEHVSICYIYSFMLLYILCIIIDSKPDKLQLICLLIPIAYKWKEIGEALEIRHGALTSLHQSNFSDEQKLFNVLQLWIDDQPTNVKWSTIITAIESPPVDNLSIAERIRFFLSIIND